MFLSDRRRECVLIASRKGFCKHALRAGADLIPVYIFGQTQLFYTLGGAVGDFFRAISRAIRVSIIPFVGRSWLSPFIPMKEPLTVVLGSPIHVPEAVPQPTAEQVDALHAQFCSEVRRIFDQYKNQHPGYADKRLYFEDEVPLPSESEADREELRRRRLEEFHLFPAKL